MIENIPNYFKTYDKENIIRLLQENPEEIQQLLGIAVDVNHESSWRACWMLRSALENGDRRISEISSKLVEILPVAKDNHQREIVCLLDKTEVKEQDEGKLFDACITMKLNFSQNRILWIL